MIQIIGWMMCGYFVVKGLELFGQGSKVEGNNNTRFLFYSGAVLSMLCAPIFYSVLSAQVEASNSSSMPSFTP